MSKTLEQLISEDTGVCSAFRRIIAQQERHNYATVTGAQRHIEQIKDDADSIRAVKDARDEWELAMERN